MTEEEPVVLGIDDPVITEDDIDDEEWDWDDYPDYD